MAELNELTGKQIPDGDEGISPARPGGIPQVDIEAIERATGLNLSPEAIASGQAAPDPVVTPVSTPHPSSGIIGAAEAEALGIAGEGTPIDPEQLAAEAQRKRMAEAKAQQKADTDKMFEQLLAEEDDRMARLDATLNADDETKKKLLGDETPVISQKTVSYKDRQDEDRHSGNPIIAEDSLMPAYSDNDDDDEELGEEKKDPEPGDDDYGTFIKGLEHVDVEHRTGNAVKVIKEPSVSVVPSNRYKKSAQNLGDTALQNAINKFKKDHFAKVTVPLVNSGFMCDVVGTGVVDLQMLYVNVDRNMSAFDYQLEQMAAVIRNVVGTSPKVPATSLRSMIHADDFAMLAYGHICATLRKVETVTNCTECGKPFRISGDPTDLLLNMDELHEKAMQIENAPNIEANSLMTSYKVVECTNGIQVTLGHPSYAEQVRYIQGYQEASKRMTSSEQYRFRSMLNLLYMIRKIELPAPANVVSNSIYQIYTMLSLLSNRDLDQVTHTVEEMQKDVILPRFGVKDVKCPHCGHIIKEVSYGSLFDLVFYHTTISSYLNNPES